jgi:cephalosporin-C deacetylase-like acetyl esterase
MTPEDFDSFWNKIVASFKALPISERNHLKRMGLEPDKEMSRKAFNIIKNMPPTQISMDLGN